MLPADVPIWVALGPVDLRCYAELGVMRSCGRAARQSEEANGAAAPHNHDPCREGRSEAISLSGARNRPRRSAGGSIASMASSLAVGSART